MKAPFSPFLLLALAATAAGQSADSFVGGQATPQPPAEQREPSEPVSLAEPSRYAGDRVDSYVTLLASTFSMRTRDVDPFGRFQDPNRKPPKTLPTNKPAPSFKTPETPFSDIVAAIPINAILPAEQSFLVEGQSFRVGDRIPLQDTTRGKMITIQVVAVDARSVSFRNTLTGEIASVRDNFMPAGMQRGGEAPPPGVVRPGANVPLKIAPASNLSTLR